MKVMKFGGTSMGSVEALRNVVSILKDEDAPRVVVVSAMSKVTNLLIQWMNERQPGVDEVIENLHDRHVEMASALMGEELREDYHRELRLRLDRLRDLMVHYQERGGNPKLVDAISSWGERLSSLLLTFILRSEGLDAVRLTSETAGVIATGYPGNASADLEATSENLKRSVLPLVQEGKLIVLTGYYGCDEEGRPLTLGRGGSDYSAGVVAYCLDADRLEIWTDVDGFMTADPRIVPGAKSIEDMNYREAAELAYFGAKVLHARTMEPVRLKSIPVWVRNTFNPHGEGTHIHELSSAGKYLLRSVAVKPNLSIIKVYSSEITYDPGLVSKIITSIGGRGVNSYAISTSLSTLAVAIHSSAVPDAVANLNAISGYQIERIKVKDNVCLICAVGDNLIDTPGVAARVFDAVEHAGANLEMISEGASDVALNFLVPSYAAPSVVRALHDLFIGD
ncbi:MAG: aspartate kinase [Methanomassiliicoccales archaeon]